MVERGQNIGRIDTDTLNRFGELIKVDSIVQANQSQMAVILQRTGQTMIYEDGMAGTEDGQRFMRNFDVTSPTGHQLEYAAQTGLVYYPYGDHTRDHTFGLAFSVKGNDIDVARRINTRTRLYMARANFVPSPEGEPGDLKHEELPFYASLYGIKIGENGSSELLVNRVHIAHESVVAKNGGFI